MAIAIVLYIVVPALCLLGMRKRECLENSLRKDATLAVRGAGMLFIVFTHMAKANICKATYFFYVSGAVGVAACFFVSGYGLHMSYTNKPNYLKGFWKGKLFRLLLPYVAAYGLYVLLTAVRGNPMTAADTAYHFFTITLPGVTFWYMKIQLLMYAAFYVSYRFLKSTRMKIAGVFFIAAVYILAAFKAGMASFWYNSCLFFPLGLVLAEYRERILPVARKNGVFVVSSCAFAGLYAVLYFYGRLNLDFLIDTVYMLCFCTALLWLVQRFTGFHVLTVLGKYSIEIYLIHTVIGGYFDAGTAYAYCLLPLVSLLLGIPVHRLSNLITDRFIHYENR